MQVSASQIVTIIYWILIFIILIIVLIQLLPNVNWLKKNNKVTYHKNKKHEDPKVNYILNSKKKQTKKRIKYMLQKFPVDIKLNNNPSTTSVLFNYNKLIDTIEDPIFLSKYKHSILESLRYKYDIYITKYEEVTKELNESLEKKGTGPLSNLLLDTATTRLERIKIMIEQILREIPEKISSINITNIKQDLKDAIYNEESGLVSLIGRDDIKDFIALLIFSFSKNPYIFLKNFQNILLFGGSGVGKTKTADTIGFVLQKSWILLRRKFKHATKQEFTSSYVNESAQITRELLFSTLEGILFIDEAYELGNDKNVFGRSMDHGNEAITEMVNFIDKNIGLGVIIAAGYEKDMQERFLNSNEGMPRRFPNIFKLDNYDANQLTDILLSFLNESLDNNIILTNNDASVIYTIINFLLSKYPNVFPKQAGDMKNLSAVISKVIYGCDKYSWENDNTKNNSILLTIGINNYLASQGLSISYN